MFHKINLLNFDRLKMKEFFRSIGEKSFCADQVMIWIYHYFCDDFNKMTNIKITLREKLKNISIIKTPKFIKKYYSIDGTVKWIVNINNHIVETVYIPEKSRGTLCISSQVGCVLNCHFCSTGQQKFNRNLLVSEIIGQIWIAHKKINKMKNYPSITNIVMMGMGEPLLNLNNVVTALKIMSDNFGFNISKKKITISTSGIVPALNKLSNIIDIKLAISLHASNDELRNKLMPINKKYNISLLLMTVTQFLKKSKINKKGITIEYIMLHNINDTLLHAQELVKILKNIPSKINLIPWNSFSNSKFLCSKFSQIQKFSNFLINKGFITTVRKSRGQDIHAACGQLTGIISHQIKNSNI
ncbi:Dual-specificity RNA methyltransferase RlmN [Buchnera aphidicola (Phyllaphis fagi)]|uniref:23S rRNA (adenine(2503)-C(2))-methyltransferase RlmN n=1 Tax=Buchnera aphidicola TaxID=9 RepID=UPI003464C3BF